MTSRKFPQEGTPAYEKLVKRVERGDYYGDIADSVGMTHEGLKNALKSRPHIRRKPFDFAGVMPPSYEYPESESWEGHLRTMKDMDRLVSFHQRVPSEITIEIPTDKPVVRVATSDWHLGMFGVDLDSFQEDIEFMVSVRQMLKERFGVNIGGDGYHNIIQPSKMGSGHNQTPISIQKGVYFLTLEKLEEAIDTIRTGNHNYWAAMLEGEDWDMEIARKIKLLYMKHFGVVHYKVGNYVYPWLMLHKGRFNSSFNLTHTCKQYQRMNFPRARVVVTEHQHLAAIEQYRYDDKECIAIRPGTYAVWDDWAQQNGCFGAHISNPAVVMYPDQDKLIGFKDMRDAVVYLNGMEK